jgi:hypothetical protein
VNLGELEGVRPALEEMRDFLTIGLEHLTGGRPDLAPGALRASYIQTIFKVGFDQVARLRDDSDRLAQVRGFQVSMLDDPDKEFVEALRRFKPLMVEDGRYRNFQSTGDVQRARARLEELVQMVGVFVAAFPVVKETLRKTFNTATVQFAVSGKFEPVPLNAKQLESFLASGFRLPEMDVPPALRPFAEGWWRELREELEPLGGKPIDPRFIASVHIQL